MSYYEDDDDGYRRLEDLLEDGWLTSEDGEELRSLFKHLDVDSDQTTESAAAYILMEMILNPHEVTVGSEEAARLTWAKVKLGRNGLI